jgi:hypothetical protein
VVALTSLGGRDTGAGMAPAVVPPRATPAADATAQRQLLQDDIEE